MPVLIVDGMNVIGTRPDGWWRDRDAAVRALLQRLQRLSAATGELVMLVLDGRPLPDVAEGVHGGVEVTYARRAGPDAADDRIVEILRAARPDSHRPRVVTSDRRLRQRAEDLGADVRGASELLGRLDTL